MQSIFSIFDYRIRRMTGYVYPHKDSADPSIRLQAIDTSKVELSELPHAYVHAFPYCGVQACAYVRRGAGTLAVTDVCFSMHAGLDPTWFGTSVIYNHLRSLVCPALLAATCSELRPRRNSRLRIPFFNGNNDSASAPRAVGNRAINNDGEDLGGDGRRARSSACINAFPRKASRDTFVSRAVEADDHEDRVLRHFSVSEVVV